MGTLRLTSNPQHILEMNIENMDSGLCEVSVDILQRLGQDEIIKEAAHFRVSLSQLDLVGRYLIRRAEELSQEEKTREIR